MFDIRQANFKSACLLNKMVLVQFQRNRTADGTVEYFAVYCCQ